MRCVWMLCVCLCVAVTASTGNPNGRARARARGQNRSGGSSASRPTCKNRTTFRIATSDLEQRPFTYRCQRGPVAEAEMVGVKGRCRGYSANLLSTTSRCHWNTSCTLTFEGKPLVRLTDNSREPRGGSAPCLGSVPDQIEMSYTCLKKNTPVLDILGEFVRTGKREGIVRSHRLYPWTYRNGVPMGNITFNRPARPAGLVHLWISVRSLGILHSDYLFLSWQDTPNSEPTMRLIAPNDTTFAIENVQSATLTFYADYDHHHSEVQGETKGFVLCFQWLKRNKTPKRGSTCTRPLQPAKCRSGGGNRRARSRRPRPQGRSA